MKLIIASNNKKKIAELRAILTDMGFETVGQSEAGITLEPEETGATFVENAYIKAQAAMERSGCAAVADDSGLEVAALDGKPGIYSARYGGDSCRSDTDRTNLLIKNMQGISDRQARFVASIVCIFPDGSTVTAQDHWDGEILDECRGEGGFGYDPVFCDPKTGLTAAELPQAEKNKISHRAKALIKFRENMEKYNANR